MAVILKEPYYVLGSKLSVGAFDQGIFEVDEPDVNLDVWGTTRFRGGIDLTDANYNFGGTDCSSGGNGAVVFGSNNASLGFGSLAQGQDSAALGNGSVAIGKSLVAASPNQAVFGRYNVSGVPGLLLAVGDGLGDASRADALRVYASGNVFANALTTNTCISLLDPLYTGALTQSRRMDGVGRGLAVDANTAVLFGPQVQLSVAGAEGLSPQLSVGPDGAVVDADTVFYGNVTFAGQTISTETSTVQCSDPVLTVAHDYAAMTGVSSYDLGLMGERAAGNTGVVWREAANTWAFISTREGQGNTAFQDFSYANLRAAGTVVDDLAVKGAFTMTGDLTLRGSTVMNNVLVSNTFEVAGPGMFDGALTVEGPSVLNTVFVANQVVLNNGLFPSKPDAWPIGQVDNRFGRAYLDTLDVFDQLRLSGGAQDTFPARLGAFGEANIYLYTTSPVYQDTVGLYFDKGQGQLPFAKSALVQRYDQWALRTAGIDRLVANTVTGNLTLLNDAQVGANLTVYGAQSVLTGNARVLGTLVANAITTAGSSTVGGNLTPAVPDAFWLGGPGQRFANAWLDAVDVYQPAGGAAISVGSATGNSLYVFSNVGPCAITLDSGGSAVRIQQNASTFLVQGVLSANTVTGNTTLLGDQAVLGNAAVSGTSLTVQNDLVNPGNLAANTASFANGVVLSGRLLPGTPDAVDVGAQTSRFRTAYFANADLNALSVGGNVYVYSSNAASMVLDRPGLASSFWSQGVANAAWGTGAGSVGLLQDDRSLAMLKDVLAQANLSVAGSLLASGPVVGNTAAWSNQVTFTGPLLPATANSSALGAANSRFAQAYLQRLDVSDALTVGGPNVFFYCNSGPVSLTLDRYGAITQSNTSLVLSTLGAPRIIANVQTGNVTLLSDVSVGANLQVFGQTSSVAQDLRVCGRLAANGLSVANATVLDGNVVVQTANMWSLGTQNARFAQAFLTRANLYNQDGGAQWVGSSQSANLAIVTDNAQLGQTASLFFDKAGLSRTVLGQDAGRLFIAQQGNVVASVPNSTGNLVCSTDVVAGSNLVVYGRSVRLAADLNAGGTVSSNGLVVSNTFVLSGNLLALGNVCVGNAVARVQAVSARLLDVYSDAAQQAVVAGPNAVTVQLASNSASPVTVAYSQGAGANATCSLLAQAFVVSTAGVPRLSVGTATGNVLVANDCAVAGNVSVYGPALAVSGNLGLQGAQARWPLDFNAFAAERTIGFAGQGWHGSNSSTQELVYQATGGQRFQVNNGSPSLALSSNGAVTASGTLLPAADVALDIGTASARWRQVTTSNVISSADSTFNGAVVGSLGGAPGAIGLASNVRPGTGFALAQHPSGNTFLNATAQAFVKLCTGNAVGASFAQGQLRVGDAAPPSRCLDVVRDAGVGGCLFASQSAGYTSSSTLLTPASGGWLQLGNVTLGNGAHLKLSLVGQANLSNAATLGGETAIYVAACANGQSVSGSWFSTGTQQLLSSVRLQAVAANTYSVLGMQGSNTVAYAATAKLTNASFSHACQPVSDPGLGSGVVPLQQQLILNGFSVIGNSTGVLSNALGGQPWLFNGNTIIYANYPNVGVGTQYPTANLDVRGSLNFTGALLNNGQPLAVAQILSVSNAFVSSAADPNLQAGSLGVAYPSSFRIGDSNPPTGVLEVVQGNTAVKIGGPNGRAGDISTSANTMSFNVSNASPAWTFTRLANYGNLATKTAVATITADGSYVQSSDGRWKSDVRDVDRGIIDKLALLRPKRYVTQGDARVKYGLIAQEVQEVLPELVHSNEAGFLSVNYMGLIPLLLSAVVSMTTHPAATAGQ